MSFLESEMRKALEPLSWTKNPLNALGLSLGITRLFSDDAMLQAFCMKVASQLLATFHPDKSSADAEKYRFVSGIAEVIKNDQTFGLALKEFRENEINLQLTIDRLRESLQTERQGSAEANEILLERSREIDLLRSQNTAMLAFAHAGAIVLRQDDVPDDQLSPYTSLPVGLAHQLHVATFHITTYETVELVRKTNLGLIIGEALASGFAFPGIWYPPKTSRKDNTSIGLSDWLHRELPPVMKYDEVVQDFGSFSRLQTPEFSEKYRQALNTILEYLGGRKVATFGAGPNQLNVASGSIREDNQKIVGSIEPYALKRRRDWKVERGVIVLSKEFVLAELTPLVSTNRFLVTVSPRRVSYRRGSPPVERALYKKMLDPVTYEVRHLVIDVR